MTCWYLASALSLVVWPVYAQFPMSGTLSDRDWPLFRAGVARGRKNAALGTGQGHRYIPDASQLGIGKTMARDDPSRDSLFAELRGTREFEAIASAVLEATPPISHSSPAFVVSKGDLVPESIAYDPKAKYFYLGSMEKGKVIRCSGTGNCTQFADGLGTVLGIKVHGSGLWLLTGC